jgi:hypothetical protein
MKYIQQIQLYTTNEEFVIKNYKWKTAWTIQKVQQNKVRY